jgi:predicted GNAT superfamily acetyltransferase
VVTGRPLPSASPDHLDPASIEIRPLATLGERLACVALQRSTWGDDFSDVVPTSILKVSQRIGGVAVGAFDADGALVGFVFGLTGVERGQVVHWSDMLAVEPRARNLGLGRRLKEYQRQMARQLGASVIYWTYDPLIARNAHLNFNRLGVRMAEYVEDMYGITDSVLHGGIPTDRIVVAWPTQDAEIEKQRAEADRVSGSPDCQVAPLATADWILGAEGAAILPYCLRVEVPLNGEALLLGAPDEAIAWRHSVRREIQWGLGVGYTISAFFQDEKSNRGYYLMTKASRMSPANGRT